jgi:hypothetical protein
MRTFVLALGLVAVSAVAAGAQPVERCSHDIFAIGGQPVGVSVCAPDGPSNGLVAVTETVKGTSTISHAATIQVLAGAAISRGVDDVALAPLGLSATLHLTLAYADGKVSVEHALLLPGAVPLK